MHKVGSVSLILSVLLVGCNLDKSKSPLSPSVAGPIAGVTISAPRVLEPSSGARVLKSATPLQLLIENASSSGQRALTYRFELASDSGFGAIVFTRADVQPGQNGRTAVGVPISLQVGQNYYWRARATDGANTGPFSDPGHFVITETVALQPPVPVSPINNTRIDSRQVTLRTNNAVRSGPVGSLSYDFELATNDAFSSPLVSHRVPEQANTTQLGIGMTLDYDRTYFWRVRAVDPSLDGPWSAVQVFRTPEAPSTPPPPPPPPPSQPPPPSGNGIPSVNEGIAMVAWVKRDLAARGISTDGDCGAFEITRRVAWNFRDRGAGLERKPGGRNCRGHSIDIIIFPGGQTVDMLIGSGDDNEPAWQLHGVLSDWRDWWIAPSNPD